MSYRITAFITQLKGTFSVTSLAFFQLFWLFYFWNIYFLTLNELAFFGQLNFLCRFGKLKDDFGRFWGTGRFIYTLFLDTEC